ncbi:Acetyltransferase [Burkholderiales bacterium]|nr:Acetyltransferase [Burkholderiales bacterium]
MRIEISLADQVLLLFDDAGQVLRRYRVSTAARGPGENRGSHCTPRGAHVIRAKIGGGAAINTVFVGRRPTGEIYTPETGAAQPQRDWILSRILWLSGCEPGRNRLGDVDTMRRYIYIHGAPDELKLGVPASQGCVRMRNADIIELFEFVPAGTPVSINELPCLEQAMPPSTPLFTVRLADWNRDRDALRRIRYEVFVIEQKVDEALEWDGIDSECRHALAIDAEGKAIGCGRLLPDGHIGRMAVLPAWRGHGVGQALLRFLMALGRELGHRELLLNAQTHALGFYAREGFEPFGEEFDDAGIAHRAMRLSVA